MYVWEQKIYKKPLYLLPYFCCVPKTSRKKIKPIIKKKNLYALPTYPLILIYMCLYI